MDWYPRCLLCQQKSVPTGVDQTGHTLHTGVQYIHCHIKDKYMHSIINIIIGSPFFNIIICPTSPYCYYCWLSSPHIIFDMTKYILHPWHETMNWCTVAAYEDNLRKVDRKLGSLMVTTLEEILSRFNKYIFILWQWLMSVSNDSKVLINNSVWSLGYRTLKIIIQWYVVHSTSIINVKAHYLILFSS